MLDQSKQATLGAATIVFNAILAYLILGDQLVVLDVISIGVILVGTIVAMADAEPSAAYTFDETLNLLEDPLVYGWVGVTWPLVALLIYAVERTSTQPQAGWVPAQRSMIALGAPFLGGWANNHVLYTTKVVTSVMFGQDWAPFRSAQIYVYIAVTVLAVFCQVRWLNTGLRFFAPGLIVPVFQVVIIIGGALHAVIYFHDLRYAESRKIAAFGVGAAICASGIALLQVKARRQARFAAAEAKETAVDDVEGAGEREGIRPQDSDSALLSSKDSFAIDCGIESSMAAAASGEEAAAGDSSSLIGSPRDVGIGAVVRNPLAAALGPRGSGVPHESSSRTLRVLSMAQGGLAASAQATAVFPEGSTAIPTSTEPLPDGSRVSVRLPEASMPLAAPVLIVDGLTHARQRSVSTGVKGRPGRGGAKPDGAGPEDRRLVRQWYDLTLGEAYRAVSSRWCGKRPPS